MPMHKKGSPKKPNSPLSVVKQGLQKGRNARTPLATEGANKADMSKRSGNTAHTIRGDLLSREQYKYDMPRDDQGNVNKDARKKASRSTNKVGVKTYSKEKKYAKVKK